jgi:hypothetical protein
MLVLILLMLAFVLFLISGFSFFRVPAAPPAPIYWHYGLVAIGLACWVLSEILKTGPLLTQGH